MALALAALTALPGCAKRNEPLAGPPPELWFYQIANLSEGDCVERIAPLWTRAAKAGYRRVVLADHKFGRLGDMRPAYFEHAAQLRQLAPEQAKAKPADKPAKRAKRAKKASKKGSKE